MPGSVIDVRQQLMLEIDREQHDQRAAEHQARRQQRSRAVVPPRGHEHRAGQRLDDRIADADRGLARAAARAQHQPAERPGCSRTTTSSRPQCGHADEGQTIDAPSGRRWMQTFRKLPTTAPNAPANTSASSGGTRVDHERRPFRGRRFFGRRPQRRGLRQLDAAVDQLERRAGRIERECRAARARATSACQSAPGAGAPRVVVERRAAARRSCRAPAAAAAAARASLRSQSISAVWQNRRPHRARRLPVAALRQRRRGQRAQPPRRAGHVGRLAGTTRRRRGSRGGTSSARSRCPACTAICRGARAAPFPAAQSPDPGGPAPRGYGSAEEDRAESVGDVEPRIERRRDVEQRIQQRKGVRRDRRRRFRDDRLARAGCVEPLLGAAVVLNRADPVDVGGQRVVGAGQPPHGAGRAERTASPR